MSYIDGYVIPVPPGKKQAYLEMAERAAALFQEYGATRVVECWGDDLPDGQRTDFRKAVAAEPTEGVVFSWIEWPSKAARDAGNTKMREDARMQMGPDLPFDGKRLIWGGFEMLIERGRP